MIRMTDEASECHFCGCRHRIPARRPTLYTNTRIRHICRHCGRPWVASRESKPPKTSKRRQGRRQKNWDISDDFS